MRIPLGEPRTRPQARRKRRVRRQGLRSFETAIAQPAFGPRRRVPARRSGSRPTRADPVRETEVVAQARPEVRLPSISVRMLLARWWVLTILAGLVAALVYAFTDARFFVYRDQASIVGAHHLDPELIYEAAGIDKQSIFWIDPQLVAERLHQLDGVRSVRVRCSLPASVTIGIEEREPRVLWRSEVLNQDFWLDDEGVVLPYHGDPYTTTTVFVVDTSARELKVGDRIEPDWLVSSVLQMAEALPGTRVFYYQADRGLSFFQERGTSHWPVFVGTSADLVRKMQVVEVLSEYLEANRIQPSYVDVRWADRPVYGRPGAPVSPGGN